MTKLTCNLMLLGDVRSPTCEVLAGAVAKKIGGQSILLGAPGYRAPVKQQPWKLININELLVNY